MYRQVQPSDVEYVRDSYPCLLTGWSGETTHFSCSSLEHCEVQIGKYLDKWGVLTGKWKAPPGSKRRKIEEAAFTTA
jgi:hypothetical protein